MCSDAHSITLILKKNMNMIRNIPGRDKTQLEKGVVEFVCLLLGVTVDDLLYRLTGKLTNRS